VSETRLDMDDHSQRFRRAKLQLKALLQQPEAGSVITRTPWTVMSALTSSPCSPQLHTEPDRPAPCANSRYAPPNQGIGRADRPGGSTAAHPPVHPPRWRRARAASRRWALTKYCPARRVVIAESARQAGEFRAARTLVAWPGNQWPGDGIEHGNKLVAFIKGSFRFRSAAAAGIVRIAVAGPPSSRWTALIPVAGPSSSGRPTTFIPPPRPPSRPASVAKAGDWRDRALDWDRP
jgi:hypothetical protein